MDGCGGTLKLFVLVFASTYVGFQHAEAGPRIAGRLAAGQPDALIAAALAKGLRPSLPPERALDPMNLLMTLAKPPETLDINGDSVLSTAEVAAAVRGALNAPLFSEADAAAWLREAAGGNLNISLGMLSDLRGDAGFAEATHRHFAALLAAEPQKFSRFSQQAALMWSELALQNATRGVAARIAAFTGRTVSAVTSGEPLQVIRYTVGGHYAPHSDSGWPGHRTLSILIYLHRPEAGGETCFLPGELLPSLLAKGLESYSLRCSNALEAEGALCLAPARGEAVVWPNLWRGDGTLELPGAHAACPVRSGEKWVASAWL
eukprot:gnl/TRDRNA2_/TRDRNA2_133376_c0_seq1.p1 gnl/TRDRNA2_/TRDRNA2_133376_c0~~gnl/TRDRNA2_/TRDRNA2_133376_c0_seq1.p1  ORF type:complete len:319 (-),score=61.03 gnl/TRDRNA2_/TRDRNA2_133376_c0_seq1:67-1023(-)